MATAPPPDAIDRQEAFAAIAKQAAERAVVGQNAPVEPRTGVNPYLAKALAEMPPGGLAFRDPDFEKDALLPNGSVRLAGQVYQWAEMKDGTGAWVVVVGG